MQGPPEPGDPGGGAGAMPTKPGLPMPNAGGARRRSRGLGHRGWGGFGGRKKKSRLIICDQTGDLGRLPFGTFSEVTPFYTWGTAKECTDFWGCESKVTNTTGLHGCLKPDLGVGLFIRWGWDKGRTRAWIWRPPGILLHGPAASLCSRKGLSRLHLAV